MPEARGDEAVGASHRGRRMLDVAHLGKRFGSLTALDGVSFAVGDGQVLGFLGPNGSGKTTTMRAILGLLRLDRGDVRWNGRPVDAEVRARFGYMPEERGLYPRMRVGDQVAYFARLAGLSRRAARSAAERWLDELGLGGRLDADVQSLSHGNQQRVQLAVALAHDPDLLVLDEPFSGLDPLAVEAMQTVLAQRAAAGAAVLFSSHQLDLVQDVCRDVVIIDGGRVVLAGAVDDLRAASPTRTLELAFALPTVSTGWAAGIPGLVPADASPGAPGTAPGRGGPSKGAGTVQRFAAPADLDLGLVVARAAAAGRVERLSFEPPDLSAVFRAAVAEGAAAAGEVGSGGDAAVDRTGHPGVTA